MEYINKLYPCNILLTGDFNASLPKQSLYPSLCYDFIKEHSLNFHFVYLDYQYKDDINNKKYQSEKIWTTCKTRQYDEGIRSSRHCIDYIFTSQGNSKDFMLEPRRVLDLIHNDSLENLLPEYPSDHLAIAMDFTIFHR